MIKHYLKPIKCIQQNKFLSQFKNFSQNIKHTYMIYKIKIYIMKFKMHFKVILILLK